MKWEREPKRTLNIQNASDYKGQLGQHGNDFWHNTDKVFIVNGQCNKADGNFLSPFFYKEIGNLDIVLGSYPSTWDDISQINHLGCTAVLDLQTSNDHHQREVNPHEQKNWYQTMGIHRVANVQVSDIFEDEYAQQLFEAVQILHKMKDVEKHKVFVHCSAGISRGPTLLIVYLSLYLKLNVSENVQQVMDYVESEFIWEDANLKVAKYVVDTHPEIQQE